MSSGTITVTHCGVDIEVDYDWTGVLDPGTIDEPPDMGDFTIERMSIGGVDVSELFSGTDTWETIEELAFEHAIETESV